MSFAIPIIQSAIQAVGGVAGQAVKNGGGAFNVSIDTSVNSSATSGFSPITFGNNTVTYGNGNNITPTTTATATDQAGMTTPPATATIPVASGFSPGAGNAMYPPNAYAPAVTAKASMSPIFLVAGVVLLALAMKKMKKG